ncbi:DEKNAAC103917 [Brettanomyces naardenensis]|uniref:DEKNAAC103917 n=1 Tax=Brettanomyces naardenensis TaxID=13370 RepID=A0A448YPG3_BRENA|nr:DEKNAAC103917 [Brettanomyces naardenensis]
MINASTALAAENDIVLSEEDAQKKGDTSYRPDRNGNYTVSSGRGGAGNIQKVKDVPSPKFEPKKSRSDESTDGMEELRPIYSVGRGGAGNMIRNKKGKSDLPRTTIEEDLGNEISPVHSGHSDLGLMATLSESRDNNRGHKFLSKIKKALNF